MRITVTAHRWLDGWELRRDGDPITQVRTLDKAVRQVIDYYDTIEPGVDHSGWEVVVVPDIGKLGEDVAHARRATVEAADAAREAAKQARRVVRELRAEGYSVTDTAAILGVSRGRVSQLT